jgi:hypothetical protein
MAACPPEVVVEGGVGSCQSRHLPPPVRYFDSTLAPPHTAPVHHSSERRRRISVCVAAVTVLLEMKQCERSQPLFISLLITYLLVAYNFLREVEWIEFGPQ